MSHNTQEHERKYILDLISIYRRGKGKGIKSCRRQFEEDMLSRPIIITTTEASYGNICTIIIELQGSPPRLPIIAMYNYVPFILMFDYGRVPIYGKKQSDLTEIVKTFLIASGYHI